MGQPDARGSTKFASAVAFAACLLVGAVGTGVPFALLRRTEDPLSAPFQPVAVYLVQLVVLVVIWGVCLSERYPWMSRQWSPWVIGFLGPYLAFVALGIHFLATQAKEPLTMNHILWGLVYLFWFWGWAPTFALGFIGGAFLGFTFLKPGRRN